MTREFLISLSNDSDDPLVKRLMPPWALTFFRGVDFQLGLRQSCGFAHSFVDVITLVHITRAYKEICNSGIFLVRIKIISVLFIDITLEFFLSINSITDELASRALKNWIVFVMFLNSPIDKTNTIIQM
ncbi:hypothetical protein ROZALSC1DRAFT_26056, partial [Rozella allomycis CSF55]